ncbi:MAG TPA: universal stress protein [Verrucomicrobiae bacterium]|jgi:nucleotide-binding universal stress UspA family protein|nr:universal stress protein [Verrucomicrobiae bacterium]
MKIKPARQSGHVVVELSASDSERLSKSTGQKNRATSPFKLKKILVPIDFSDCSKKALEYAIPFAKQFHARMIFLHVLPAHYAMGREAEFAGTLIDGDLKNELETRLIELVHEAVPSEIFVDTEVRHGAPSTEIVNAAKEMDVDVIVMSTHGHTGRVHAFIGSVAGDVVRLAPCPVFVVREREHEFVQSPSNPFKTSQDQPSLAAATAV